MSFMVPHDFDGKVFDGWILTDKFLTKYLWRYNFDENLDELDGVFFKVKMLSLLCEMITIFTKINSAYNISENNFIVSKLVM